VFETHGHNQGTDVCGSRDKKVTSASTDRKRAVVTAWLGILMR